MDQVKAYLRILKKHHFWLLVGVTAVFGLVCWWMGANSLAADTKKHLDKVKGSYKALEDVIKGKPANGTFVDQVGTLHGELKKEVLAEWQKRYDAQQLLFIWPEVVAAIAQAKPGEDIKPDLRLAYKNLVFDKDKGRGALQKLYERADYRRFKELPEEAEAEADREQPMNPDDPAALEAEVPLEMEEGLVVWDQNHRLSLEQRYDFNLVTGTPSTLNVRLAQEDLWVLEQMTDIIRRSNDGATDIFAATVKRIESLEIAQWAVEAAQHDRPRLMLPEAKEGAGGPAGMGGLTGGGAAMPETGEPGKGMTPEEMQKKYDDELMEGRYLDDQGQPLAGTGTAPYAEFKMLFVRMKLVVDQRKISDVLYNCVTAPLPIEIRLVRMDSPLLSPLGNTTAGGSTASTQPSYSRSDNFGGGTDKAMGSPLGGAMGSMPMGGMGSRGALGGGMGRGGIGGFQPAAAAGNAGDVSFEAGPFDVPIEICGVVQIFNPPDEEKLASGSGGDAAKRALAIPTNPVKTPRGTSRDGMGMGGGMGRGGLGGMPGEMRGLGGRP